MPQLDSDYPFGIFKLLAIMFSFLLRYTDSDYPFGIFWALCCLFLCDIQILITSLWYLLDIVLSVPLWYTDSDYLSLVSFGHCVVCSSVIYRFWLPPFGIFWPLHCLFLCDIQILITSLWYLQTLLTSSFRYIIQHNKLIVFNKQTNTTLFCLFSNLANLSQISFFFLWNSVL